MTLEEYIDKGIYHKSNIAGSYHNHNYLCRHAGGTVKDYIDVAERKGYEEFGISDHGPLDIEEAKPRMSEDEFYNNYLKQFDEVKTSKVKVLKALEFEYFEEFDSKYQEYKKYLDYMILGQHIFKVDGKIRSVHYNNLSDDDFLVYEANVLKALKTGYFKILAHPEIVFHNNETISSVGLNALENIIKYCVSNDILLEVNANGLRRGPIGKTRYRYPRQEYLDLLKKYNAKIIVSDDAHNPNDIKDKLTEITYSYLEDEGFNLVYKL